MGNVSNVCSHKARFGGGEEGVEVCAKQEHSGAGAWKQGSDTATVKGAHWGSSLHSVTRFPGDQIRGCLSPSQLSLPLEPSQPLTLRGLQD